MKKICFFTLLAAIVIAGCERAEILSVEEKSVVTITGGYVVCLVEEPAPEDLTTVEIICNVGAQILESTYNEYRGILLTKNDLSRMPDNRFTRNLRQLHEDLSAVLD